MAAADDTVSAAVATYLQRRPGLEVATEAFVELVTGLLDQAGINYLAVTGRTKSVESFAAKAARTQDGTALFAEPLTDITDQLGVRVVTYVRGDVAAVAELLADELTVLEDRDLGQETASEGQFGYASRHLLVAADPERLALAAPAEGSVPSGYDGPLRASVQVRTVLQHAWAEFEHDIRYKGTVPQEHVSDFDRRFTLAAGLLELADREFSTIRDRLRATVLDAAVEERTGPAADADPRIDPKDLSSFLDGAYADAGWSRSDHYAWISGLLLELGVTSLDELSGVLGQVDQATLDERLGYRYPAGAVRRLDDALLAVFGERYVALHGNVERAELLTARLAKMRGAAGPAVAAD